MNKFLTFEGQQPFYLGDIDFMQEAVRTAFTQIMKGLTSTDSPRCVVYGLQKSSSGVTAGVVCLDGELFDVPASSLTGILYLTINENYDGRRMMKSGELKACHAIRTATVTNTRTDYRLDLLPRLENLLGPEVIGTLSGNGTKVTVLKNKDNCHVDGVIAGYDKDPGWMPGELQEFYIPLNITGLEPHFTERTTLAALYGNEDMEYEKPSVLVAVEYDAGGDQFIVRPYGWVPAGSYISFSIIM